MRAPPPAMPSTAAEATGGSALATRFDAVYADHHAFVWRCLRGLGVADDGLEDAAQEVFLVVHRQLERFEQRSSVGTWLFNIARKVAANHRRTARRKDQRVQALAVQPRVTGAGPLEHAQTEEAARFVQDFLARVGDKKRDVFLLAVLEQMSMPDVAQALSIPLNTAYTRMRAVRADFQRALTQVQNRAESDGND